MNDTPPSGIVRPTPPHARPFSRPQARAGLPTPLSTQAVLFVPGESPATFGPSTPEPGMAFAEPTLPTWVEGAELAEGEAPTGADGPVPEDAVGTRAVQEAPPVVDPPAELTGVDEGEGQPVAPTARAHAEAVAQTLESLASRVRNGAVVLPPWLDDAGEAATLAGLLAVLLAPGFGVAGDRLLVEDVAGGETLS